MYTIGAFARLGGVTVGMLRHYDGLGLFMPSQVDPVTGHRYYEATQLPRLNRLVALKDLGFTLEQVGQLLDEGIETRRTARHVPTQGSRAGETSAAAPADTRPGARTAPSDRK